MLNETELERDGGGCEDSIWPALADANFSQGTLGESLHENLGGSNRLEELHLGYAD